MDDARPHERLRTDAFKRGLAAFAALHNLKERDSGRRWCGHNILGKRPNWTHVSACHQPPEGQHVNWWDHPRGFGRARQPMVIMGWPYATPTTLTPIVRSYAENLGLRWQVGAPEGPLSFYFYGATTPWLIASPDFNADDVFTRTSPQLDAALDMAREYSTTRTDLQAREAIRTARGQEP